MTRSLGAEARDLGVPFRPPTDLPRTRKALELALHAQELGVFPEVHDALFRARFEAGRDLGRVDVLVEIAATCGLPAAETRTVLGVDRFVPPLEALRATLLREGIRGVPTLLSGRSRLEGFHGAGALQIFLEGD